MLFDTGNSKKSLSSVSQMIDDFFSNATRFSSLANIEEGHCH